MEMRILANIKEKRKKPFTIKAVLSGALALAVAVGCFGGIQYKKQNMYVDRPFSVMVVDASEDVPITTELGDTDVVIPNLQIVNEEDGTLSAESDVGFYVTGDDVDFVQYQSNTGNFYGYDIQKDLYDKQNRNYYTAVIPVPDDEAQEMVKYIYNQKMNPETAGIKYYAQTHDLSEYFSGEDVDFNDYWVYFEKCSDMVGYENEDGYYNVVIHNGNSVMGVNYSYDREGNVISEEYNVNGKKIEYNYTYDEDGKILSCSSGSNQKLTYQYDENTNALLREDIRTDSHYLSYEYSYDSRSNLVASKEYDFNEYCGTTNYSVDDSIWCDELSSIENQLYTLQFLYDENGNPVSIDDVSFDWTSGRLLDSIYTQNEQGEKEILLSYTYDEKGIRTSKTYQGLTTYFTSIDGRITSQYEIDENGNISNEIIFIYNSDNQLIAFTYNSEIYYYLKNHMNDVIAVLDSEGNIIVDYVYDAWGMPYSSNFYGDEDAVKIDEINPILYRSYYYDAELCAYYLQSRYYMPTFHRFLNSDIPEMVRQKKNEYAGTNLFAYCQNNPIGYIDYNGYWGKSVHNGYNKSAKSAYRTTVKGGFYYYGTYFWALECGFSIENAKLLGEYCQELDKKYPSSMYAKVWLATSGCPQSSYSQSQLSEYRRWQYFHFNKNKSGQDSRTSFCLSRRNWAVDKWNQGQYRKALNYLGYAIHAVQDYHSHGQIGRGLDIPQHIAYDEKNNPNKRDVADNINYVWADSGWKLLEYDSYNKTRLVRTGIETKKFINVFLSRIKNRHMIKGKI